MQPIQRRSSLTDEVYTAITGSILDGTLPAGAHVVQEQIAKSLQVSRQPVQQAMAMLKAEGLLVELGQRGLFIAPLDLDQVVQHYQIRGALDALAAQLAATRAAADPTVADEIGRRGQEILDHGTRAVADRNIADMVRHDVDFHHFIYEASGNPQLLPTVERHWRFLQRAMAEVLRQAGPPTTVWNQHAAILAAIVAGRPDQAAAVAADHVDSARVRLSNVLSHNLSGT